MFSLGSLYQLFPTEATMSCNIASAVLAPWLRQILCLHSSTRGGNESLRSWSSHLSCDIGYEGATDDGIYLTPKTSLSRNIITEPGCVAKRCFVTVVTFVVIYRYCDITLLVLHLYRNFVNESLQYKLVHNCCSGVVGGVCCIFIGFCVSRDHLLTISACIFAENGLPWTTTHICKFF